MLAFAWATSGLGSVERLLAGEGWQQVTISLQDQALQLFASYLSKIGSPADVEMTAEMTARFQLAEAEAWLRKGAALWSLGGSYRTDKQHACTALTRAVQILQPMVANPLTSLAIRSSPVGGKTVYATAAQAWGLS